VQATFLIVLGRGLARLAGRVERLQDTLDREIRPSLAAVNRISGNAAEISDLAAAEVRRVDGLLADTVSKVEETTSIIQNVVLKPFGSFGTILALLKGIQRGVEVYTRLSRAEGNGRGQSRTYGDDEHLFI
jgi:threonine synthase